MPLGRFTPPGSAIHFVFLQDDKVAHLAHIGGPYRAVDVSQPMVPVEFATVDGIQSWSCYPYQPSRTIYIADIPSASGGLRCVRLTCGAPTPYGRATPGSGSNVPAIDWSGGHPRVGNGTFRVEGNTLLGGRAAVLAVGNQSAALTIAGIDLLVDPSGPLWLLAGVTSGQGAGGGRITQALPIPNDPGLANGTLFGQWIVVDEGGPAGLAASPGLRITICP
jgi:hypothetical protein